MDGGKGSWVVVVRVARPGGCVVRVCALGWLCGEDDACGAAVR